MIRLHNAPALQQFASLRNADKPRDAVDTND